MTSAQLPIIPPVAPVTDGIAGPVTPSSAAGPAPLLDVYVFGKPTPKGSMRHVGHGRMIEQIAESKPWREAVKSAVVEALGSKHGVFAPLAETADVRVPVAVDIVLTFAKPASAPKRRRIWPTTRTSGDVDKQARNVLDALVDAGAMKDDSQVVDLHVRKCFVGDSPDAMAVPGAHIRLWPDLTSGG